jgi:hypothetical protein
MNIINIYPYGTPIKTKYGGIEALIVACKIANKSIIYQISYFYAGENKTCWVEDCEFTVNDSTKQKIGFKQ